MRVATPDGISVSIILAVGDQTDPTSRFPVLSVPESAVIQSLKEFGISSWRRNPGRKTWHLE